jgi:hypothetical protein
MLSNPNSEMCMALCKLETTFAVEFLEEGLAPGDPMIIAKVLESMFEGVGVDIKLKVSDDGRNWQTTGLMITSNVKHNLTFMAVWKLRWTTCSYLIKGCVALLEVSKHSYRDVGNFGNLTQSMSSPLEQSQGSASSLRHPLDSPHDVFEQLSKNWCSIYNTGGGGMTQISGGSEKSGDLSITFCEAF